MTTPRDQIAEALRTDALNVTEPAWALRVADALMPTVDRLRAEAEAEALDEAGAEFVKRHRKHRHPLDVQEWLRDRAAAYRANTGKDHDRD